MQILHPLSSYVKDSIAGHVANKGVSKKNYIRTGLNLTNTRKYQCFLQLVSESRVKNYMQYSRYRCISKEANIGLSGKMWYWPIPGGDTDDKVLYQIGCFG